MEDRPALQPHRPSRMPDYAEVCLLAIAAHQLGSKLSLGGAFGLAHYFDYRSTHDVDAWWTLSATIEDKRRVLQAIQGALEPFGQVRQRAWGDVNSVELVQSGKVIFSFQIASRSAQLQPSGMTPWIAILLDSFNDLLASKMVALVERGAPRDFRDVYTVCQAGLITPHQCWTLWRQRQTLAGSDTSADRARLAVETHLARITRHRPLGQIVNAEERRAAERLRNWFSQEFLDALMD